MARTTAKWGIPTPSSNTDADNVPSDVGKLADYVDGIIGNVSGIGTLANRPTAGIANRGYFVNSGTNAGAVYIDDGTNWNLAFQLPGATGNVQPLPFGATASAGTPTNGWSPIDHVHPMPANPVVAHVAASNPHPQYQLAASAIRYVEIPFHISSTITTGLKKPKWIANAACTITQAYAVCDAGSGVKYQIYKNGSAPSGMTDSSVVGTSTLQNSYPTPISLAIGDYVQVDITNAGTSASDFSVTLFGTWN